jgi:uncharacterized ion transporter superfamily protein YfcC
VKIPLLSGRKFAIPHPLVLMYLLVMLMILLTWIVPAGEFTRVAREVGGETRMVPVPGSFHAIARPHVGLELLLTAPVKGFASGMQIIVFIFIIGGAFAILQATGTIDLAIRRLARALTAHPGWQVVVIPLLMVIFSLAGSVFGMAEETIAFVPIFIPLAMSLGYDSLVGVAIPFLGAAAGFAAAFFNPFTVGIAQALSGVPLFSGLTYRLISWAISTMVMIVMVMLYARRVRRNPALSPVADIDRLRVPANESDPTHPAWNGRHSLVMIVFLATLVLLVFGILRYQWFIDEIAALFLGMGLVAGLVGGQKPGQIAQHLVAGARDMVGVAFVIAGGRALLIVTQEGKILDPILAGAAAAISHLPRYLTAQVMFFTQSAINFFIHSGTAQASLTMPIMAPLGDLVGITPQTTVFAFQLCEFVNPILPTSAVTMGVLAVAKIPWDRWARWFFPLMLVLMGLACLLLVPPMMMAW